MFNNWDLDLIIYFIIVVLDWERCCYTICGGLGLDVPYKVTILVMLGIMFVFLYFFVAVMIFYIWC